VGTGLTHSVSIDGNEKVYVFTGGTDTVTVA
jgi:hypothetical protein